MVASGREDLELVSAFPCYPVICEFSVKKFKKKKKQKQKKTDVEKKQQQTLTKVFLQSHDYWF